MLHESSDNYCNKSEFIIAEIAFAAMSKLLVGVVYRPPKTGHLDEFKTAFSNLVSNYKHTIIFGNFNTNLHSNSFDSNYLRNVFQHMDFSIMPYNATHHTFTSHTWLDVCAVDSLDKIITSRQTDVLSLSSHDLIYINLIYREYALEVASMERRSFEYRDFRVWIGRLSAMILWHLTGRLFI